MITNSLTKLHISLLLNLSHHSLNLAQNQKFTIYTRFIDTILSNVSKMFRIFKFNSPSI